MALYIKDPIDSIRKSWTQLTVKMQDTEPFLKY